MDGLPLGHAILHGDLQRIIGMLALLLQLLAEHFKHRLVLPGSGPLPASGQGPPAGPPHGPFGPPWVLPAPGCPASSGSRPSAWPSPWPPAPTEPPYCPWCSKPWCT